MHRIFLLPSLALFLLIGSASVSGAAPTHNTDNPLAPLSWLMDKSWTLDDTVQEFEWGFDKKSVIARSYLVGERGRKLVSEGVWFWHPGEEVIKGYFSAKGMPFSFIESTVEFDGRKIMHKLKTYSDSNQVQDYLEVIEPIADDGYSWKLYSGTASMTSPIMSGNYKKK